MRLALALFLAVLGCADVALAQWPNEPASSTLQMDWPFAALTGAGGYNFTDGGFSLVTNDNSAPLSPPNVAQCLYAPGFAGGVSCGKLELTTIGGDDTRAYLGMWIFVSNPFQGHPSNVNKIWQLHDSGITNSFHLEMWGASAPYHLAVILQYSTPQLDNSQMGCAPFDTCDLFANVASDTLSLGAWHKIEVCTVASTTSSSANGVVRVWLDGVLVFNYTNANSPPHQFQLHQLNPIWGGVGSTKSPGNDYMRFDHIRLSRPPAGGCGTGAPTNLQVASADAVAAAVLDVTKALIGTPNLPFSVVAKRLVLLGPSSFLRVATRFHGALAVVALAAMCLVARGPALRKGA